MSHWSVNGESPVANAGMKSCLGAECDEAHTFSRHYCFVTSHSSLTSHAISVAREQPLTWVRRSWMGTAVCWQNAPPAFYNIATCCISSTPADCIPCVLASCRRHCWHTDKTPTYTLARGADKLLTLRPPTYCTDEPLSSVEHHGAKMSSLWMFNVGRTFSQVQSIFL